MYFESNNSLNSLIFSMQRIAKEWSVQMLMEYLGVMRLGRMVLHVGKIKYASMQSVSMKIDDDDDSGTAFGDTITLPIFFELNDLEVMMEFPSQNAHVAHCTI